MSQSITEQTEIQGGPLPVNKWGYNFYKQRSFYTTTLISKGVHAIATCSPESPPRQHGIGRNKTVAAVLLVDKQRGVPPAYSVSSGQLFLKYSHRIHGTGIFTNHKHQLKIGKYAICGSDEIHLLFLKKASTRQLNSCKPNGGCYFRSRLTIHPATALQNIIFLCFLGTPWKLRWQWNIHHLKMDYTETCDFPVPF